MPGDFSRQTYRPEKHFGRVLLQQGRVQLDADWNEQQTLEQRRLETETLDIVGPAGAPLHDSGFQVGVQSGRLTLSPGRFYLDGILLQQDLPQAPLFLDAQPDCPVPAGSPAGTLPGLDAPPVPGRYAVYLDAWERTISSIEDPDLRETALGGPDTTVRSKVVWQAKLSPLAPDAHCTDFVAPAPSSGTLQAKATGSGVPDACMVPPSAHYSGLENQLYRVEVHQPGDLSTATFKWSRENASVAAAIESASGQILLMHDLGRDVVLGFSVGQWVELLDDAAELGPGRGTLLKIEAIDRPNRKVTIDASTPVPSFDPNGHPKLRRWENPATSAAGGIALGGGWLDLEASIQVKFGAGTYRAGDHWTFPARTAVDSETGKVEWPTDPVTHDPLPQGPEGILHHYAVLGTVDFTTGGFDPKSLSDCRKVFPPLTEIDAGGCCSVTAKPGAGWESVFAAIPDGADAAICLPPGEFPLAAPLVVRGKGNLRIAGSGPSSRIVVSSGEGGILFQEDLSVEISDLSIQAGTVSRSGGLQGALDFQGVPRVRVHGVRARNAAAPAFGSAAIRILDVGPSGKPVVLDARVTGSELVVGALQVGLLVVDADRLTVADNAISVDPSATNPSIGSVVSDKKFRIGLRRQILNSLTAVQAARLRVLDAAKSGTEAQAASTAAERRIAVARAGQGPQTEVLDKVTIAGHTVEFRTTPQLLGKWQVLAAKQIPADSVGSSTELAAALGKLASKVVLGQVATDVAKPILHVIDGLLSSDLVAGRQGIVVGGSKAGDIRIVGNTVRGFVQGIHAGFSHRGQTPAQHDSATVLRIRDNSVQVRLPNGATGERHGIFVGNVSSTWIEDNRIDILRGGQSTHLSIDGIRAYGVFGRLLVVRANEITGSTTGILVHPVAALRNATGAIPRSQWLVADNMAPSAQAVVVAPNTVRKVENYG
jgi:hypothetical protein